ncbi:MAG: helix-turn-helix transcriptional regulator [Deltaproteobacteria bacterium]|nr:helix-turn-helix transcriptional regulator [Deltaproteobacteria bacterium]
MKTFVRIASVSQIHQMLGSEPPSHPLISLLRSSQRAPLAPQVPVLNVTFVSALYTISLKQGSECGIKYGRETYDFQEGSLMFLAPGQAVTPVTKPVDLNPEGGGWTLMFHPELIRRFPLGDKMAGFSYFAYDSHEALHLSKPERETVTDIVLRIEEEYRQNLDLHSPELIVSNLELLLNYCKRYYGRQFVTRTSANRDVVTRLEAFLSDYFHSNRCEREGIPSVQQCARQMGYSPNYLGDLLKKETGKSTREHIHFHLIEKAKSLLLGSNETVERIAYALGFEYPQHFSKLFKSQTGMSPAEYRH